MWVGYSISRAVVYLLPLRAARAVPSLRSDEQPAT